MVAYVKKFTECITAFVNKNHEKMVINSMYIHIFSGCIKFFSQPAIFFVFNFLVNLYIVLDIAVMIYFIRKVFRIYYPENL